MEIKHLKHSDIAFYREKILQEQGGVCAICLREVKRACLDHSHSKRIKGSGRIRGVLCSSCNVFLAKSENNAVRYGISHDYLPTILRSMAEYLERPHRPYLHPSERPKSPRLMRSRYNILKREHDAVIEVIKKKLPAYPKSGRLTKELAEWFNYHGIIPKFYGQKGK